MSGEPCLAVAGLEFALDATFELVVQPMLSRNTDSSIRPDSLLASAGFRPRYPIEFGNGQLSSSR